MGAHYQYGELYMEYLKLSCTQDEIEECDFSQSSPWKGPRMTRIPRPFPDYSKLAELHYRDVWNTPRLNDDKTERKPDDYSPRANIRHLFEQGDLHLDAAEEIKDFSERYAVSCELVEAYLKHLQDLKLAKGIRDRERKEKARSRKNKTVHDYNWSSLIEKWKARNPDSDGTREVH